MTRARALLSGRAMLCRPVLAVLATTALLLPRCALPTGEVVDLGTLEGAGKADAVGLAVPFAIDAASAGAPATVQFRARTLGRLAARVEQQESRERLQLVVESEGRRWRSWRGRTPSVALPPSADGRAADYELTLMNWGSRQASGTLYLQLEEPAGPRLEVVFNQPDCESCEDPTGGLRAAIVEVIGSARTSIDAALYGLDDRAVIDALCGAAAAGVRVRVVTDDESEEPGDSRSYHDAYFAPETGLAGCGVEVELVRSSGLMHHKIILVDRASEAPVVVVGSTNLTVAGLEVNHNHMVFARGGRELAAAFGAELDQLFDHCRTDRLEGGPSGCTECTPRCVEDRSEEGPWVIGDASVEVFFSPSDDALAALRGRSRRVRTSRPDPACGPTSDCLCRPSGTAFLCEYCGIGDDGFGLLGRAERRLHASLYSATDQCFALGVARAASRGVETLVVWDRVRAGSPYEQDDLLCALGLPVYLSVWDGGSAQARNHNKLVVVDDFVFDGSMNLSQSGGELNNESTILVASERLADQFSDYVRAEAALLEALGSVPRSPERCRSTDLVDNDGDGLVDRQDPDCDSGESPSSD